MDHSRLDAASNSGRCGDRPSPAPTGYHPRPGPRAASGRHRPPRRAAGIPIIGRFRAGRSRLPYAWPPLRVAQDAALPLPPSARRLSDDGR